MSFIKLADSDDFEKHEDFVSLSQYFSSDFTMKKSVLANVLKETVNRKSSVSILCLVTGSQTMYSPCYQALKVLLNKIYKYNLFHSLLVKFGKIISKREEKFHKKQRQ